VRDLQASLERSSDGTIHVAFRLEGDVSRICLPASGPAREGARLWEHTCFELFIAREGETAYHEVNVAPSREWAIYGFRDYREPAVATRPHERATPEISERRSEESFDLEARLVLSHLSVAYAKARLRIGLSAVVETKEGRLSYWALRHPRDRPDFHDPDAFALRVEPPRGRDRSRPP
jgi:hypothetical protein